MKSVVRIATAFSLVAVAVQLASCTEAEFDVSSIVTFDAFNEVEYAPVRNSIAYTASGTGEAGVFMYPATGLEMAYVLPIFVEEGPHLNLRVHDGEQLTYSSTEQIEFAVIGPGFAEEVLFYSASPFTGEIRFGEPIACNSPQIACVSSVETAHRVEAGNARPLLASAYAGASLRTTMPGRIEVAAPVSPTAAEYGVFLRLAGTQNALALVELRISPEVSGLRIGAGEEQRYLPPTQGWHLVSPGEQVLVYQLVSEPAFEVSLERVVDCSDSTDWRCRDPEEFYEMMPGEPGSASLGTAVELLEWSTEISDFAISASVIDSFDISDLSAAQIYFAYYEPDLAGGYCAGTATFFERVLQERGFEAFTWSFGIVETDLTHVTTVVEIDGKFYMLDATFGGYFVSPEDGHPLDIFSLLDGARYEYRQLQVPAREFLGSSDEAPRMQRLERLGHVTNCDTRPDIDRIVCLDPVYGLEKYLSSFAELLSRNDIPLSPEALPRLMHEGIFTVGGSGSDTEAMARFVAGLDQRGLPLIDVVNAPPVTRLLSTEDAP